MERILTWIALFISTCITILLPGVAGYSTYHAMRQVMQTEVEINARLVTQVINANPQMWTAQTSRLEELLGRRPLDGTPEARLVLDSKGSVVAEVRETLDGPLEEAHAAVHDAGVPVGTIVIQRSLRPLGVRVGLLLVIALALGTAIYMVLQWLPVRALSRAHDRLTHQATHDALTGLPNRGLFLDRLEQAMARSQRSRRGLAVLFIDLDGFKDVNDSLGHKSGDDLLRIVVQRVQVELSQTAAQGRRSNDGANTLARFGGDEFCALVESVGSVTQISDTATRIVAALAQPFDIAGHQTYISCSIGITLNRPDIVSADALLHEADLAMYRAKALGGNCAHFFDKTLEESVQNRLSLENDLRAALARHEFVLHFQPQVNLRSGEFVGFEALLRWQRPGVGMVPPAEFISTLEDSRLIVPIGTWVITAACEQLVEWDLAGMPPLSIAVNLSARQFFDPELSSQIRQVLERTGITPNRLELELTESLLMEDTQLSRKLLRDFAEIGVRVAIDDFGTGHSSLAYLKRFEVNILKIDRGFVQNTPDDKENCAICAAIMTLAHNLGLRVVCEGVETDAELRFIASLGADVIQGYRLARPMGAAVATDWLSRYLDGDPELILPKDLAAAPVVSRSS